MRATGGRAAVLALALAAGGSCARLYDIDDLSRDFSPTGAGGAASSSSSASGGGGEQPCKPAPCRAVVMVPNIADPSTLAVDDHALYFTRHTHNDDGAILRVPLDAVDAGAGEVTTLASDCVSPFHLVVARRFLYWNEFWDTMHQTRIRRMPVDGCGADAGACPETIEESSTGDRFESLYVDGSADPAEVTYVGTESGGVRGFFTRAKCPDHAPCTPPEPRNSSELLLDAANVVKYDSTTYYVVVGSGGGKIAMINTSGMNNPIETFDAGASPYGIAAVAGKVVWGTNDGVDSYAPLTAKSAYISGRAQATTPWIDGQWVIWTSPLGGVVAAVSPRGIYRAPLEPCKAGCTDAGEMLVERKDSYPSGIFVADGVLYWTERGSYDSDHPPEDGAIVSLKLR